jgi:hypothetical protein
MTERNFTDGLRLIACKQSTVHVIGIVHWVDCSNCLQQCFNAAFDGVDV